MPVWRIRFRTVSYNETEGTTNCGLGLWVEQKRSYGPKSIGNDATTYRRLRTLENCRQSGPIRVGFQPRRKSIENGSYRFSPFSESLTIPKAVALSCGLKNQPELTFSCNARRFCIPMRLLRLLQRAKMGVESVSGYSKLLKGGATSTG